jgi:hypothetical protein
MSFQPNAYPASPTPALDSYGRDPKYQCLGCGGWPVGAFVGSLEHVQRESVRVGVATWLRLQGSGELRLTCGPNCTARAASNAKHGIGPAFERIDVNVPEPSSVAHVERLVVSTCSVCGVRHELDQRKPIDGDWMPNEAHVLTLAGWHVVNGSKYCSRFCLARAGVRPAPSPVTKVDDAAYQRARATATPRGLPPGTTPAIPPATTTSKRAR